MDSLVKIGKRVHSFILNDLDGVTHTLEDAQGCILVLIFWSAECPWSKRADEMVDQWKSGWGDDVWVWFVGSNHNESIEEMRSEAKERGLEVVLLDTGHQLADRFGALTTPHCFVIDQEGMLRYRGAIDDTTFRQREPNRLYLKEAVDALLAGRQPEPADTPGYGCTIVRIQSLES